MYNARIDFEVKFDQTFCELFSAMDYIEIKYSLGSFMLSFSMEQ